MYNHITTYKGWQEEYRKDLSKIWLITTLSNEETIYFSDYTVWLEIKDLCRSQQFSIKSLQLRFRSHTVNAQDFSDADGVYLVRSVMGQMGGKTKHYYTVGKIVSDTAYKDMWLTPELIIEKSYEDSVDKCFKEAIIYRDGK